MFQSFFFSIYIYIYIFKDEIANNEIQQRSNRRSRTQGKCMYKTNHNNLDFARIKNHKDNTNYSISFSHLLKSLPHSVATLLDSSIKNNDSSLNRYIQENHHHFTSCQLCHGQNLRIVWIQAVFFRHAQKRVSLSFPFK